MLRSALSSFRLAPLVLGAAAAFAASPAPAPAGRLVVTDAVEDRDGWTVITQGAFNGGSEVGGLLPFEGKSFFNGHNTTDAKAPATNRGAAKYFTGVKIEPGVYTATFLIGKPDGVAFVGNLNIQLIADTTNDGVYTWSERIPAEVVASSRPAPADSEWATWTISYKVSPDARTAGGFPTAGATLGLMLISNTKINSGYAFDYLRITRAP